MGCDVRQLAAEGGVGAGFGVFGRWRVVVQLVSRWGGMVLPARVGVGDVRDVAGRTLPGQRFVGLGSLGWWCPAVLVRVVFRWQRRLFDEAGEIYDVCPLPTSAAC